MFLLDRAFTVIDGEESRSAEMPGWLTASDGMAESSSSFLPWRRKGCFSHQLEGRSLVINISVI